MKVELCFSACGEEIGKMFCQNLLTDVLALVYTRVKVIVRLVRSQAHTKTTDTVQPP